ncbi:MAG: Asp-tRNA(Asn)/Glu-tRNA(Gln) amidotransferase subunit GatB [Kofleriaceae bacterium]
MTSWEAVIGLEIHVQLATRSKALSASAVEVGATPNTRTDPTVLGLPGALPVWNAAAARLAVRLGLATGATIRRTSRFARKHYFYPDLPKGYQVTQADEPILEGGAVEVIADGAPRPVPLVRAHLEEDAGKSTHVGATSRIDLNRAGVPLLECVTGPDLRSPAEAAELMRALHRLVVWLGISDGDLEKGHLRCDANVSIRPAGSAALGVRTELKNINSFRFVERAIEHEIARQRAIVDGGGQVVRETRLWDGDAGTSHPMRAKEEADDYRYLPDPDLPPLVVDDALLAEETAALPELPSTRYRRYRDLGLPDADARGLTSERAVGEYFDRVVAAAGGPAHAKPCANWILGELAAAINAGAGGWAAPPMTASALGELIALVAAGTISGRAAKDVFAEVLATGAAPGAVVDARGLRQNSDLVALRALAAEVIAANPKNVAAYRAGKTNLLGFFVGAVLKASGGTANPQLVSQLLAELLAAPPAEPV